MNTVKKIMIVWNGCDSYLNWEEVKSNPDYKIYEEALMKGSEIFEPFEVEKATEEDAQFIVGGEFYKEM